MVRDRLVWEEICEVEGRKKGFHPDASRQKRAIPSPQSAAMLQDPSGESLRGEALARANGKVKANGSIGRDCR